MRGLRTRPAVTDAVGLAGSRATAATYDVPREGSGLPRASLAGCSTSATTRLAMNLAVRTGSPVRVTSTTSTIPRPVVISTRRPARVATIS